MIFVGSSDGRKELTMGFDGKREMEETELEEGEACSYRDDDDDTASIDPDAPSYIDEKLQHVLGHFIKEFEGGVSAENLGAKFGGYGSFLPVYQRSPVWSHSRSPPKVPNHEKPKPPNNLQVEDGNHDLLAQVNIPHSTKHGSASAVVYKAPYKSEPVRQNARIQPTNSMTESMPKSKVHDQRTLKVRIKVGSDNLSTKRNAAIYTGLGLDVSPSSSHGDSPVESEGLSHQPSFTAHESPTHILQIMMSCPIFGSHLLSPLPGALIQFTKRKKHLQDNQGQPAFELYQENYVKGGQYNFVDSGKILSGAKNLKSADKRRLSTEMKDSRNGTNDGPSSQLTDTYFDSLSCEELVSNALKLPLLSDAYGTVVDSTKVSSGSLTSNLAEKKKGKSTENICLDVAKSEPLRPTTVHDVGWNEKPNGDAIYAARVIGDERADAPSDRMKNLIEFGYGKGETANSSTSTETRGSKSKKSLKNELKDPQKQRADQKSTYCEQDETKVPLGKEQLSSAEKKRPKGSQILNSKASELQTGSNKSDVFMSEDRKYAETDAGKSEVVMPRDLDEAKDKYRDFFGDMNELEDDLMDSLDVRPKESWKTSEVFEKATSLYENVSKEKIGSKQTNEQPRLEESISGPFNVVALSENGLLTSDPAPAGVDADDNWVCCDKCQKWRLLPPGTKVDSLPEKWLCSMLNWLPEMNRCSISEEETTKALRELYQFHVGNLNGIHVSLGGVAAAIAPASVLDDQHQQDIIPTRRKKYQDNSNILEKSVQKKQPPVEKDWSLTDAHKSPLPKELDSQHISKSTEAPVETSRQRKKDRRRSLDCSSDGGHAKNSKIKGKKDRDQELIRASKKIKTGDMFYGDRNNASANEHATEIPDPISGYDFPVNASGKNQYAGPVYCSQNSKIDKLDNLVDSSNKSKFKVEASLDVSRSDDRNIAPKKRKVDSTKDTPSPSLCSGKVASDNEQDRGKKNRFSGSEKKESGGKRGIGMDKTGERKDSQPRQELGSIPSQHSLHAMSVAVATSSSSKVSISHKCKANLPELEGSPVESVSSSPLRISSVNKFTSGGKIRKSTESYKVEKNNFQDAPDLASGSPRRHLFGEDDCRSDRSGAMKEDDCRSDRSGAMRKDKVETETHDRALETLLIHLQEKNDDNLQCQKVTSEVSPSTGLQCSNLKSGTDVLEAHALNRHVDQVIANDFHHNSNGSSARKSGKDPSSQCKDKELEKFKPESDKGKTKISESCGGTKEHAPGHRENRKNHSTKVQENIGFDADKTENCYAGDKNFPSVSDQNCKKGSKSKSVGHGSFDTKADAMCNYQEQSIARANKLLDREDKRSSKQFDLGKPEQSDSVSKKDKSHQRPPVSSDRNETLDCPQPDQSNGATASINAPRNVVSSKGSVPVKKADIQNGSRHYNTSKHAMANGHRLKGQDAPSPIRRDSSSQAATNAVKEAKDLKHLADRLKNAGSVESTGLYFEAALKFLHGAALLESGNSENSKHGEMIQSMQIYSSTAKLCEFCAHEFEKSKDMASAALAYKCMEVAYLRVIYSSNTTARRDRNELQTALQMVPSGESPSSSASDVDNLNNFAIADKAIPVRDGSSPHLAGNHVIAAGSRPHFLRLLNFARDVNKAMEASRKSRIAFSEASISMRRSDAKDGIPPVKRALDFNFQDVDGLLRLVRLAKEAISH